MVGLVRVTLVAETFLPAVNGVVNSVLRVSDELLSRGDEPTVVAPATAEHDRPVLSSVVTASGHRLPVVSVPSVNLPGYRGLNVARPASDLRPLLAELNPDVVHLASPALLGWSALQAARAQDIATVAVFQTDLSGFLHRYHLGAGAPMLWAALRRLHNLADLTLVPSSATAYLLRRHGIGPLARWARGVDAFVFDPDRRDDRLRAELRVPLGYTVVGFVGRLAAEKRVELLAPLSREPGVTLVIIGDGPRRAALQRLMPDAHFLGLRTGTELGRLVASLDLLVHPGADETFCQVVQEALSAGVPVVSAAVGGPLDLVRHGDNGWLWAGDDPELLAAQVAEIRSDRSAYLAVRGRTRASVAGRTWAAVTDQLVDHYRDAMILHRRDQPVQRRIPRAS